MESRDWLLALEPLFKVGADWLDQQKSMSVVPGQLGLGSVRGRVSGTVCTRGGRGLCCSPITELVSFVSSHGMGVSKGGNGCVLHVVRKVCVQREKTAGDGGAEAASPSDGTVCVCVTPVRGKGEGPVVSHCFVFVSLNGHKDDTTEVMEQHNGAV